MSTAPEASDYVLLHRDTGSALYTTRATEEEIARANTASAGPVSGRGL